MSEDFFTCLDGQAAISLFVHSVDCEIEGSHFSVHCESYPVLAIYLLISYFSRREISASFLDVYKYTRRGDNPLLPCTR
jgi:hypothetical protein